MKLGGELTDPVRPWSEWERRVLFLKAIEEEVPQILSALHSKVLPIYLQAVMSATPSSEESGVVSRQDQTHPKGGPVAEQHRFGPRVDPSVPVVASTGSVLPIWTFFRFQRGEWETGSLEGRPELLRLRDALEDWACPFGIGESWVLDVALDTLTRKAFTTSDRSDASGSADDEGFAKPRFMDIGSGPYFRFEIPGADVEMEVRRKELEEAISAYTDSPGEETATQARDASRAFWLAEFEGQTVFEHGPFFPLWDESWKYRRRVIKACRSAHGKLPRGFKVELDRYIEERMENERAEGGMPAPTLRARRESDRGRTDRRKEAVMRPFRWLARAVAGETATEIAKEEGVSRRAVQASNNQLADELPLPWKAPRGRPPAS